MPATGSASAHDRGPFADLVGIFPGKSARLQHHALPPLSSTGTINIATQGSGSIDLVVDCSGYFATS